MLIFRTQVTLWKLKIIGTSPNEFWSSKGLVLKFKSSENIYSLATASCYGPVLFKRSCFVQLPYSSTWPLPYLTSWDHIIWFNSSYLNKFVWVVYLIYVFNAIYLPNIFKLVYDSWFLNKSEICDFLKLEILEFVIRNMCTHETKYNLWYILCLILILNLQWD